MSTFTLLRIVTAVVGVTSAALTVAQTGAGAITRPQEPTVTEPTQVTQTKPNLSTTTEPRGPALGQPTIRQAESEPLPEQVAGEPAVGPESRDTLPSSFDRQQATDQEKVEAFTVIDADGDLRLSWQEIQQQGLAMEVEEFNSLDNDNTEDLDRGEFVGIGSR